MSQASQPQNFIINLSLRLFRDFTGLFIMFEARDRVYYMTVMSSIGDHFLVYSRESPLPFNNVSQNQKYNCKILSQSVFCHLFFLTTSSLKPEIPKPSPRQYRF